MNKVLVTMKNKEDSLDIRPAIVDYAKEIDPSSPLFYENMNEVIEIAEKTFPGYSLVSIKPTVEITEENRHQDAFGNKIPYEEMNVDEAKKKGII